MIQKRNNIRPFELVLGVIILYSIMPIVQQFFSDFLTTYAYMVLLLGAVVFTILLRGTQSLADSVLVLIPFILWMLLELLTKDQSLLLWGYSAVLMLAPVLFGMFTMKETGPKVVRFFAIVLAIVVLITMVTTIIGSTIYPDAARYLATVETSDDPLLRVYNYVNLGGYEFVYTCILLYPAVIFAYKQRKLHLAFAIIAAVLVLVLTLNSGYTTAFLLWIASTALFFFPRNLKKREVLILLLATIVLGVIFFTVFSSGIKSLAKLIDNEDIAYRLEALSGGSEGIRASEDDRIALYEMSINAFFKSPLIGNILGTGGHNGGHSFILDFAAQYGLIGVALLVAMYRIIFVRFFKPYEKVQGYGYIFWMFLQTLILSAVNTQMWINVLCWFLPISITAILQARKREDLLWEGIRKPAERRVAK